MFSWLLICTSALVKSLVSMATEVPMSMCSSSLRPLGSDSIFSSPVEVSL